MIKIAKYAIMYKIIAGNALINLGGTLMNFKNQYQAKEQNEDKSIY